MTRLKIIMIIKMKLITTVLLSRILKIKVMITMLLSRRMLKIKLCDDNSVIVEDDTDESFGTRDSDYHDISNNENIQKFSSVMLSPMKSTICYRSVRDDGCRVVHIISRGGKATGKYKNYLNI